MQIKDASPGLRVETKLGLGVITGTTLGRYIDVHLDRPIPGREDMSDRTWQAHPRNVKRFHGA